MTASRTMARHGSTSYGSLSEERFKAVLRGDEATDAEIPRLEQALTESARYLLYDLAVEIDMEPGILDDRIERLLGRRLLDE